MIAPPRSLPLKARWLWVGLSHVLAARRTLHDDNLAWLVAACREYVLGRELRDGVHDEDELREVSRMRFAATLRRVGATLADIELLEQRRRVSGSGNSGYSGAANRDGA